MRTHKVIQALAILLLTCPTVQAGDQRPNILFIAIDDLRPEIGAYGSKAITPNIDRLAASGTRFDRAYCQQSVCGASRLSIMCGLYPTFTGEHTFDVIGWRDRLANIVTLNQHFRSEGYRVIGLGKIYHEPIAPGVDIDNWDQWIEIDAEDYALAENLATRDQAIAAGKVGDERDLAKGPTTEKADVDDDAYADGQRAARAIEVLTKFAEDDTKPFFLAVGFTKPHLPFTAPSKYWDLYRREDFKMPPNKEIPPGYPPHAANPVAHEMTKYSDYEGERPTDFSDELNHRLLHGYAASTSYVDACVGRVLDSLRESDLADNTIVVLWGDHGWKLGDHSSWCKHTNFECDTRVPLVVRDPRLPGGSSSDRAVELIDIYPTLCDLTGTSAPAECQGKSFSALLRDPGAEHRQDAYSCYPIWGEVTGHSIRFGNYRYTEWRHDHTGAVEARVLTDLQADPGEVTNVIDDPLHEAALHQGAERLEFRIQEAKKPAGGSDSVSK